MPIPSEIATRSMKRRKSVLMMLGVSGMVCAAQGAWTGNPRVPAATETPAVSRSKSPALA